MGLVSGQVQVVSLQKTLPGHPNARDGPKQDGNTRKTLRKEGGKKVIDLNNTDRVLHLTNHLKHPTRI